MERIYKNYKSKITRNYELALNDPTQFADNLNNEYAKLRQSKSKALANLHKLPVRIYGAGDYIPAHYKFLKNLNFKFYIISKSLTLPTMRVQLEDLLKLPNLTSIVLSFDKDNLNNYANVKQYFNQDKVKFAYTGTWQDKLNFKESFNIFFNISDKKSEKQKTKENIKERCPCDSGELVAFEACSKCNKCWRSSITKDKEWNKIF